MTGAVQLVCNGRSNDGRGRLCGFTYTAEPGESSQLVEQRLRVRGWRLGPPGEHRHVMCPSCAKPATTLTRPATTP